MLVSVRDTAEAAIASHGGADIVEIEVDPAATASVAGVSGPTAIEAAGAILRLRFPARAIPAARGALATRHGVEIALPVGVRSGVTRLGSLPRGRAVAVVAPTPDPCDRLAALRDAFGAVMLEADAGHRLIDDVAIARLDAFAIACRANGLAFGFAGGLEAPDVARLLLLTPDVLGFDRAVRRDHRADGALDPGALEAIRALIPRDRAGPAIPPPGTRVRDRVFVRDFVVPLAIGAYQAEHGVRQRVRFGVEAEVLREPKAPADMRDVFSYDIIIETIRVLAERAHITFVETLAEEIAAALLAHSELAAVTVTVEKLDVIGGTVGIVLTRERAR